MNRFFVKHKLSINDTLHLSDSDSELVINQHRLKPENFIEIETYEALFLGVITDISSSSVEVEIVERISEKEIPDTLDICLIQSLIGKEKFNFLLEKSVEIGVDMILPVESQYSTVTRNKAIKEYGLWKKIVKDAVEQSRNTKPLIVEKPLKLQDLEITNSKNRICLSTENSNSVSLKKYIQGIDVKESFLIAIGPERGWSSKDLVFFEKNGFTFIKLEGNILRTETAGLVISSIIKYLKGEI